MSVRRRGDAQWRIAFELLAPMKPDEVIPYSTLAEAYDTDDLNKIQRMVWRANRDLLTEHGRKFVAVTGVGFRMIRASEHSTQARRHERLSRTHIEKAIVVVAATHLDELTPTQREQIVQHGFQLQHLQYALDDHEKRLNEHNDLISGLQRSQADLQDQVAQLNDRMKPTDDKPVSRPLRTDLAPRRG